MTATNSAEIEALGLARDVLDRRWDGSTLPHGPGIPEAFQDAVEDSRQLASALLRMADALSDLKEERDEQKRNYLRACKSFWEVYAAAMSESIDTFSGVPGDSVVGAVEARISALNDAIGTAEIERDAARLRTNVCEVCWTCSWSPCPEDHPGAREVIDGPLKGTWAVCDHCSALAQVERYKTLEEAARGYFDAPSSVGVNRILNALDALDASSPSERGDK